MTSVAPLLVLGLVLTLAGCPAPPTEAPAEGGVPTARAAGDAGPAVASSARPPHPNMATAAWGQRVLEERVARLPPSAPDAAAKIPDVLAALHDLTPGATARAAELAAAAHRSATGDVDRANAVALLAVALVLDPTVDGYKERLTDAHGLAMYAGALDASDALGQSARALVLAGAGSLAQSRRLVEVVATTPNLNPEARAWLALARRLAGDVGDELFADLRAAVAARPTSARMRAALAESLLDVGLALEAAEAATGPGPAQPWLDAVRGRALVLEGKVDEGIALLQAAEPKVDEGRRGDALYWLGRSLTQKPEVDAAEIEAIAAKLSARPGFDKEGAVLAALLAQRAGDYAKAKELVAPHVRGRPMLPVDGDASWLLVDACAGLGDLRCVDEAGKRARAIDGDEARYQTARAAAVLVGKASLAAPDAGPAGDAAGAGAEGALGPLREAHRASPFDPKLAAKVGDPAVDGGPFAAARVRAARKALLRRGAKLVDVALAPVLANKSAAAACRVCRALDARAAAGIDSAQKAAKALTGAGPPLALADLVDVIDALGRAPTKDSEAALAKLDDDKRPEVTAAVARARADHRDPDGRKRRDARGAAGPSPAHPPHGPHAPHGHAGEGAP